MKLRKELEAPAQARRIGSGWISGVMEVLVAEEIKKELAGRPRMDDEDAMEAAE